MYGLDQKAGSTHNENGILFSNMSEDIYATKLRKMIAIWKYTLSPSDEAFADFLIGKNIA